MKDSLRRAYDNMHKFYAYSKYCINRNCQKSTEDSGADILLIIPAFPQAFTIRSGILLVCKNLHSNPTLLLVKEKEGVYNTCNGEKIFPSRYGPPKGAAILSDKSALETAERELYEETNIMLRSIPRARLLLSSIVYYRPEVHEAIIYFIVFTDHQPPVQICNKELSGYAWVDMKIGLSRIQNVSIPTQVLFGILDSRGLCNHNILVNTTPFYRKK